VTDAFDVLTTNTLIYYLFIYLLTYLLILAVLSETEVFLVTNSVFGGEIPRECENAISCS